jgi:hypothetical protein
LHWLRRRIFRQAPLAISGQTIEVELESFRQAEVVQIATLPIVGEDGSVYRYPTPDGAVVVTQTCDIVIAERPNVQLAPLVHRDPVAARESRLGRWPQYVHVPNMGDDAFADMSVLATISKALLVTLEHEPGVDWMNDDEQRNFGRAVGRRFSRFPFPDEVTPWLRPLQGEIQSKVNRPDSPLAKVLSGVIELRLEAINGWNSQPPYDLVLIVIVRPGVLPGLDEVAEITIDATLRNKLYDNSGQIRQKPAQVAQLIVDAVDAPSKAYLWTAFGDALAKLCRPRAGQSEAIMSAVSSIAGEVVSEDELSYARAVRSDEVDLDHLSPPRPY